MFQIHPRFKHIEAPIYQIPKNALYEGELNIVDMLVTYMNLSRSEAIKLIRQGSIRINNEPCKDIEHELSVLDLRTKDEFTGIWLGTKKDKMKRLTDIISGDFRCVVVNLVSKSLRFEDNTFSYKANKTADFFIGPKKKKKEKEIEESIIKSNFFNKRPF